MQKSENVQLQKTFIYTSLPYIQIPGKMEYES